MKKSIKLNYIFNAGYQIFTIIVPLITAPYISRALGADGVGTYSYTFAIVSYFTLASTLGAGTDKLQSCRIILSREASSFGMFLYSVHPLP